MQLDTSGVADSATVQKETLSLSVNTVESDRYFPLEHLQSDQIRFRSEMKISEAFNLGKTQAQLDFVDVDLARDTALFIDPFAISQRLDTLSQECHLSLHAFFQ